MKTCEYCGANLDPQEICDCTEQKIADGRIIVGIDLASGKDTKSQEGVT